MNTENYGEDVRLWDTEPQGTTLIDTVFVPVSETGIEMYNDFEPVVYQSNRKLMAANAAQEINELQERNHATTAYSTLDCVATPLFPTFNAQRLKNCHAREAEQRAIAVATDTQLAQQLARASRDQVPVAEYVRHPVDPPFRYHADAVRDSNLDLHAHSFDSRHSTHCGPISHAPWMSDPGVGFNVEPLSVPRGYDEDPSYEVADGRYVSHRHRHPVSPGASYRRGGSQVKRRVEHSRDRDRNRNQNQNQNHDFRDDTGNYYAADGADRRRRLARFEGARVAPSPRTAPPPTRTKVPFLNKMTNSVRGARYDWAHRQALPPTIEGGSTAQVLRYTLTRDQRGGFLLLWVALVLLLIVMICILIKFIVKT